MASLAGSPQMDAPSPCSKWQSIRSNYYWHAWENLILFLFPFSFPYEHLHLHVCYFEHIVDMVAYKYAFSLPKEEVKNATPPGTDMLVGKLCDTKMGSCILHENGSYATLIDQNLRTNEARTGNL